jgi:hypothetical protein
VSQIVAIMDENLATSQPVITRLSGKYPFPETILSETP